MAAGNSPIITLDDTEVTRRLARVYGRLIALGNTRLSDERTPSGTNNPTTIKTVQERGSCEPT